MKVRSIRTISKGDYVVSIRTEEFSEEELRWISEMGEPEIMTGGEITPDGGGTEVVLPEMSAKVRTGFKDTGVSRSFSGETFDNPKAVALGWETEITGRIISAMLGLKSSIDSSFRGESVTQPDYS